MDVTPTIQHFHGRIRSISGTNPAANTEISETVPARRRWRILSIQTTLVTDANVADRTIAFVFDDGTKIFSSISLASAQAASLTYYYVIAPYGIPEIKISTTIIAPIPPLILPAGFRIRSITTNRQTGDNFDAPQMLVEEWIDP